MVKIEKEFKNGNKIISVTREVTTYFKIVRNEDEVEIQEKNTIDNIQDNKSFTGYTKEFWKEINKE